MAPLFTIKRLDGRPMKSRYPEGARLYARKWLLEQLFTGRWRNGQALDASAIAAQLNLSPSPVREALARLHGEGIIAARHREGYSTIRLMPDELAMEYRLIGSVASELAGRLLTPRPEFQLGDHQPIDREGNLLVEVARAARSPSALAFLRARMTALTPYRVAETKAIGPNLSELQELETLLTDGSTIRLRRAFRAFYERRARSALAICRAAEQNSESFGKVLE